ELRRPHAADETGHPAEAGQRRGIVGGDVLTLPPHTPSRTRVRHPVKVAHLIHRRRDDLIESSSRQPVPEESPVPDRAIDTPVYEMQAELFKALGHPVRIRTLELLRDGDQAVSTLLEEIGIEASHLSQHLAVLRRTGVVTKSRRGNTVTYRLVDPALAAMLDAARAFLVGSLDRTSDALTGTEAGRCAAPRPPPRRSPGGRPPGPS